MTKSLAQWGIPEVLHTIQHKLEAHGETHKFDWISARLMMLRNVIIAALVVVVALALIVVSYKELTKDVLVINGFDVPAALEERGYSSRVIGRKLFDQITYIRSQTLARIAKRDVTASVWKAESDVAIPDTKFTVGSVFAYLRSLMGRDTFIDGELILNGDKLSVTVRQRGKPSRTISGKLEELDALMLKAAEHVMRESQPAIVALFLYNQNDLAGSLEATRLAAQSSNPEESSIGLTNWGSILKIQGDAAGARAKWEESIRVSPKTSIAWRQISSHLLTDFNREESVAYLQQYTRMVPDNAEAWAVLSFYAAALGNATLSKEAAANASRLDPNNQDLVASQAYALLRRGDYLAVQELGERLERIGLSEQSSRARNIGLAQQVSALTGLRDHARALALARRIAAETPLSPIAHRSLAAALNAVHEYDEAIASMKKAISLGALSNSELTEAMLAKGDLETAQKLVDENLKRKNAASLAFQGEIYRRQGKFAESVEKYRELIARIPETSQFIAELGKALAVMGDLPGAEAQFKEAIRLAPKMGRAHLYWGDMLAARGDHAGAMAKYQKANELEPKWGEPYAGWGDALSAVGDKAGAQAKWAKALELEPKHPAFQKYKAAAR